jgi:hypothetical protein
MGATISYNGATIATIENGHSWTIPKTAKPQTNVEIQFDGDGSINYRGENTNIAKGKMARLLCKDKLLASDVVVSVVKDVVNLIPNGATYKIKATNTLLNAGDPFPATVEKGDVYTFEDYEYTYTPASAGWTVSTWKNRGVYSSILGEINKVPVTDMTETFYDCYNMTTAPVIPQSVTNMERTFYNCTSLTAAPVIPKDVTNMDATFLMCTSLRTVPDLSEVTGLTGPRAMLMTFNGCKSLTTAPVIPEGVTELYNTFGGCTSLRTAPVIPESVTNMYNTFGSCTSLTTAPVIPIGVTNMYATFSGCSALAGSITINATPSSYNRCLKGTQVTEILGSCGNKSAILATK